MRIALSPYTSGSREQLNERVTRSLRENVAGSAAEAWKPHLYQSQLALGWRTVKSQNHDNWRGWPSMAVARSCWSELAYSGRRISARRGLPARMLYAKTREIDCGCTSTSVAWVNPSSIERAIGQLVESTNHAFVERIYSCAILEHRAIDFSLLFN